MGVSRGTKASKGQAEFEIDHFSLWSAFLDWFIAAVCYSPPAQETSKYFLLLFIIIYNISYTL